MAYTLPNLPYSTDALEPHIDASTMEIHHGKHHQAYITKVNAAIEGKADLESKSVEELISNLDEVPEDIRGAVRNNGGGHANHTLFWSILSPNGGGEPTGALADAIKDVFGSFSDFQAKAEAAGVARFGSGWVWLSVKDGQLELSTTANQDSPCHGGGYANSGDRCLGTCVLFKISK